MGAPESISIRSGQGPICTPPLVIAGSLSTTPSKPALQAANDPTLGGNRTLKVKIVNPSASGTIAWALIERGTATPGLGALVATYAANAGSHITPGTTEIFSFDLRFELVLVADSAANDFSVTSVPF